MRLVNQSIRYRTIPVALVFGLALWGCASGPEQPTETPAQPVAGEAPEGEEPSGEASEDVQKEEETASSLLFELDDGLSAEAVSYFRFGNGGEIFIGYEDSHVGRVDGDQNPSLVQVYEAPYRVLTVNEEGTMAMLQSEPSLLVRMEDQEEILRMNELGDVYDAAFSVDGSVFVAAVGEGRVHIWHRGEELLRLPDETIQKFLDRQMPDFTAQLSASGTPLWMTADRELMRGDRQGRLAYWNPRNPSQIRHLANFDTPPTQIRVGENFGVASTDEGKIGVFRFPQGGFYRWSMGMDGDQVFAHPSLGSSLIIHHQDRLMRVALEDGNVQWEVQLPSGEHCGLEGDEMGEQLLVCIEGQIAVVSTENGTLRGLLYRSGDQLTFQ